MAVSKPSPEMRSQLKQMLHIADHDLGVVFEGESLNVNTVKGEDPLK